MTNRFRIGLKVLAGITALISLAAVLSYFLSQRPQSPSSNNDLTIISTGTPSSNAPQETSSTFRFGVPVESEENALIAAQSGLRTSYRYREPLTVITVEKLSYEEYYKKINQPLNDLSGLTVWLIIYQSNEWTSNLPSPTEYINDQGQVVPLPTNMVPSSQFRGCVYVAINADDGSLVEVGGPLQQGIFTECN